MGRLIYLLTGLLLVLSCQDAGPPAGIIKQDEMVSLFTDIHLANGILSTIPSDSGLKQQAANYYQAVYNKYNTDSIQYKKSLKYYSMRPILLDTMYYQVGKNLQRINDSIEETEAQKRRDEAELALINQDTTARPFKIQPLNRAYYNFYPDKVPGKKKPDSTKAKKAGPGVTKPPLVKPRKVSPDTTNRKPKIPGLKVS